MDRKIKKGQVTIFIILGIVVISSIILSLVFRQDLLDFFGGKIEPEYSIRNCVSEVLESSINKVLENAGDLQPELTKMYNGSEHNYLCYQFVNYLPCVNTHPMIKSTAEQSLTTDSYENVVRCFSDLKKDLENRGYNIEEGELNYSLELVPGNILVKIEKNFDISKEESFQSFEDFSFEIPSQMYGLFNLVREVINQESQFCYFDYNGFMTLYPEYRITRVNYDSSLIYTALNRNSNEKLKFAIRGCTFPAGL